MSEAQRFITRVVNDAALREQAQARLGNLAAIDETTNLDAAVALGAEHGFHFTVAELRDAYRAFLEQQLAATDGELSETELETVAGGKKRNSNFSAMSGCCA